MEQGYIIYVTDTETTGTNPQKHEVIEVSMCRLIPTEDYYTESQETWLVKATNPNTIEDEALKINGHIREDILGLSEFGKANYKDPKQVINEIELWLLDDNVSAIDRIFAGQNPNFDIEMLKTMYSKAGVPGFPFAVENGNRIIDTKQIITLFDVCTGKRRQHYNLAAFVKALGVKKGKAHKAAEDTIMTKDVLLKLISFIKEPIIKSFSQCYPEK